MEVARDLNIEPAAVSEFRKTQSLSSQLWGIDWEKELEQNQKQSNNGFKVFYSQHSIVSDFLKQHFSTELTNTFSYSESLKTQKHKAQFYNQFSDSFIVKTANGSIASVVIGNTLDWSSYYFRFCATHPEHRRLGIQSLIVDQVLFILNQKGVERVSFDFNPLNRSQLDYLNTKGFFITGNTQSDRWGQMLQATIFLDSEAKNRFSEMFGTSFVSDFKK